MRNILATAAMAAMVFIGCNPMQYKGDPGEKGPKGDKGDPGTGVTWIGKDCQTDADCGETSETGKCGTAKFCRLADSDELTATVRKRRTWRVEQIKNKLVEVEEELVQAQETCMDSPDPACNLVDEVEKRLENGKKALKHAEGQLALVTPAPAAEPPKTGATAKADDKAGKKDEKVADAKKPADKKKSAVPSPSATSLKDIEAVVGGLALKVTDAEGRLDDMEGGQQTLQTKMGQVVASLGELDKKVGAAPVPDVGKKPAGGAIINKRRLDRCVSGRLKDPFFGEDLDKADRQIKADAFCVSKQQAG